MKCGTSEPWRRIQILAGSGGSALDSVPRPVLENSGPGSAMFKACGKLFMKAVIRKATKETPGILN